MITNRIAILALLALLVWGAAGLSARINRLTATVNALAATVDELAARTADLEAAVHENETHDLRAVAERAAAAELERIVAEVRSRTMWEVTAYCPDAGCCGRWADGMTASGRPVTANGGRFVAGPPEVAFGTTVRVPGYAGGAAVPVLDRGGAIRGKRLDVFFATRREALAWGRQTLAVEIVEGSP